MKILLTLLIVSMVNMPLLAQETVAEDPAVKEVTTEEKTVKIQKPVPITTPAPSQEITPEPKKQTPPKPVIKQPVVKQKAIKTIYVNDRLFLGVTKIPAGGQKAIATLKNGVAMQLLEEQERYSKVRLEDGKEGWVRNLFISDTLPLSKQVPKLKKDKEKLQQQIEALKKEMQQREQEQISPQEMFAMQQEKLALHSAIEKNKAKKIRNIIMTLVLSLITLGLGCVLGYSVLAKRIKQKFNGMKVW